MKSFLFVSSGLLTLVVAALVGDPTLPRDTLPNDFGARVPAGLVAADFVDAPPEAAHLALGRELFFDSLLSIDRTVSCASCHDPAQGFADGLVTSPGVNGTRTLLHTPSLFNRGFGKRFSWTGHVESLHAQVLLPIPNGREMGLDLADAAERLRQDAHYAPRFRDAFGEPAGMRTLSIALAAFVSRIYAPESVVDRFQSGVFDALDDRERAGLWLYESKAGCWRCHSGRNYTDEDFHATGVGAVDGVALNARFDFTSDESDHGKFKTPTLRGLTMTAPYMHDGSLQTLEDVVAYYRRGGNANAQMDVNIRPLDLSDDEAAALVAFLHALSRPPTN